jgi:hypothetical protein
LYFTPSLTIVSTKANLLHRKRVGVYRCSFDIGCFWVVDPSIKKQLLDFVDFNTTQICTKLNDLIKMLSRENMYPTLFDEGRLEADLTSKETAPSSTAPKTPSRKLPHRKLSRTGSMSRTSSHRGRVVSESAVRKLLTNAQTPGNVEVM